MEPFDGGVVTHLRPHPTLSCAKATFSRLREKEEPKDCATAVEGRRVSRNLRLSDRRDDLLRRVVEIVGGNDVQ
ncbi:MAG: hypothetical protein ACXW3V_08145, partial [Methylocystis sp.]